MQILAFVIHSLQLYARVCVCVFWLDPIVWQHWEDEDWSPKNTPVSGWLAVEERDEYTLEGVRGGDVA